jgi:uncharacterized protein with HEPN domain
MKDKNSSILKHMIKYCKQIEETRNNFNNDREEFFNNHIFRNATSMAIFQIGELANRLTEAYQKETISEMNWREIVGMRNFFAHGYSNMDIEVIWDTAISNIPALKEFCIKEIARLELSENKNQ